MAYRSGWQQPKQDTGWGLIFRLNFLLNQIEKDVEAGDLNKYNLHLDRIYVNILFKEPEDIIIDEKNNVVDVSFSKNDTEVFKAINSQIDEVKKKISSVSHQEDKGKAKEFTDELYRILQKKDVWIRKKMKQLGVYLQQVESDPRHAIYGG